MYTTADRTKSFNWGKLIVLGALTLALLAGVAIGVNWLWDKRFGPTTASAADCTLAQKLVDQAQSPPKDAAAAQTWEKDIRQVRYSQFENDGISTEVGRYVTWQVVKATGTGERPTAEQFDDMKANAAGHCDGSGVDLRIPAIAF
jgi:hypothetical protein